MKRRDFLKNTLGASAMLGLGAGMTPRLVNALAPSDFGFQRTLVNCMLLGGADLRYLFVPEPGTAYADKFWEARSDIYLSTAQNQAKYGTYADVWADLYQPTVDANGTTFGIHKAAGWLKQQFDLGNVAIISNVLGSDNRRHDQSQLIVNAGDVNASQYVYDRDGWGGRLTHAINNANAVSVTRDISVFCNGTDPQNRNAKVVHAKDTRNFGLSNGNDNPTSSRSALARALKGYYAAKRLQVAGKPQNWPYHKFLQHEESLRRFGDIFNARLADVSPLQPDALRALYTAGLGTPPLNSTKFGLQCASLYDSFLGADLFQMRVASMEYSGWDTHNQEQTRFETNVSDIFGAGGGLDTLSQELAPLGTNDNTVYLFTTDFGRQLRANGDYGTDHGRGNYMILVGPGVNGGVYGEMFPASEITGPAGQTRFDQRGADIEGRTSFEQVLTRVCDWVEPGTGAQVLPDANLSMIEAGVDLDTLFPV